MSVMVADHNYSSLKDNLDDKKRRVQGSKDWVEKLVANTDRKTGKINQPLDEHLLGVARFTAEFCRKLPILHEKLPRLVNHEHLIRNTNESLFAWQNKAFKLALSLSEHSETHGFFGVNMASTGCGKTIGNARIMYALSNPKKGARLTIALGLRVLTLQTGKSFRKNLKLNDSQLAILVGGLAQKQLFEYNQNQTDDNTQIDDDNTLSRFGNESADCLIDEYVDSDNFDGVLDDLQLDTVIEDKSAWQLLASPIVTCTIDHLMQACECKRGGGYIAPMLRLFSGDLILDEPDDFDQNDMPALSRLVHLAGLFGSRVLLSSATLPPDMLYGLFQAYVAGRKIYNEQFGYGSPHISCAWFDENNAISKNCQTLDDFNQTHQTFIQKRGQFLQKQPIRRMAEILPINATYHGEKQAQFYQEIAKQLLSRAKKFHDNHHVTANNKNVSVGLIRMANIQPLMKIAQAMHQLQTLDESLNQNATSQNDTHFYLCCYHSQQVLALRNRLENRLDGVLNRHQFNADEFVKRQDIAQFIAKNPTKTNHVFIVLATPVAEVGRDHDYDWAMVEPSSMRSIIQLAGRVWRHRSELVASTPNIGIWQYNIRALTSRVQQNSQSAVFNKPGFESKQYLLDTHDMAELIEPTTLQKIDAMSRIQKPTMLNPKTSLVDLEHQVMADLMNNSQFNVVNAYFQDSQTSNRSHVHLSALTPFRAGRANIEYIVKPSDDTFKVYHSESVKEYTLYHANTLNSVIEPYEVPTNSPLVDVWLDSRLDDVLAELEQKFVELSSNSVVIRFSNVALAEHQSGYYFDERFGCWKKD
ncbi:type I-F CRISPR-associated helicase Cas3f [Moraxella nasovis]|uniref:type I-F CRISPR-associated helicase Cas3f n=1 Tax=Moraxella nasovis TaxID=2904121 RepID=UPI001F60D916|nr:type I-F CRISPR-associated helicase Cas3f [Moraxella nasovis]UNU73183.1 type I-F CRISPR-associated helicase Cas3f [Moraxella nasovis]